MTSAIIGIVLAMHFLFFIAAGAAGCECDTAANRVALTTLYQSTGGASWGMRGHWTNESVLLCLWGSVHCVEDTKVSVYLSGNKLQGTLPPELSLLSVDTLNIDHNKISGSLPASLSLWGASIRVFTASHNDLTGAIPPQYSNWTAIETLELASNALSGTLAPVFAGWAVLKVLNLSDNSIKSSMPPAFSNWTSLVTLDVSKNLLTGTLPSEFGDGWKGISSILLHSNQISGTIPPSLGGWASVTSVSLSANRLSGTLPRQLCGWVKAYKIQLDGNMLEGTLPMEYAAWEAVSYLELGDNNISGTLPPEYRSWTNIQNLALESNKLRGCIPNDYYDAWTKISSINLGNNDFSGTLSSNLSRWLQMMQFDVHSNRFEGTLPESLAEWFELTEFDVSGNRLIGTLPVSYANWTLLERFAVYDNVRIDGTLPEEYGEAWVSNLTVFLCYNTAIRGTLPASYALLSELHTFAASVCRLHGTIPAIYAKSWTRLVFFSVDFNNLTGTLPSAFFQLPDLQVFTVASNLLHGSIALDLCMSAKLQFLMLSKNNFSGTISDRGCTQGGWTSMQGLLLDNIPFLAGTLPRGLKFATYAALQNTSLCGAFPQTWRTMRTVVTCPDTSTQLVLQLARLLINPIEALLTFPSLFPSCKQVTLPPCDSTHITASRSLDDPTPISSFGSLQNEIDVATAFASFTTGAEAFALRRTALLATLRQRCDVGVAAFQLDASVDITNAPLQLRIGATAGSYHRGAVIGNVACWIITAVCAGAAIGAYRKFRAPPRGATWASAAAALRLPGGCIVCVVLLLQQTVVSSTLLVSTSLTGADTVIGTFGLASVLALLGALLYVLDPRSGRFSATARDARHGLAGSAAPVYVGWRHYAHWLVGDRVVWVPRRQSRCAHDAQRWFVQQFGLLFASCCSTA